MKTRDGRDLPVAEITAENYVVPKGEEKMYHVKQEIKQFNPNTGERLSTPCIQKYGQRMYESVIYDNLLKQGYTIDVLHNPREVRDVAEPETTPAEGRRTRGRNA